MPAPSGGAACVANGLATTTTRNAKNVDDGREDRDDPDDEIARPAPGSGCTAAAPKPVRTSSQRSSDPSCPPQNAEIVYAVGSASLVVRATYVEREVVAQERREENAGGDGRRDERRDERVLRRAREPAAPEVRGVRAGDERVERTGRV